MTEKVIDSDQIETMIGEVFATVAEEPVACRLELVRIQDGAYFLQWHIRVIAKRTAIDQTLGLSFTLKSFDLERLRQHVTKVAAELRVRLMARVAEGN